MVACVWIIISWLYIKLIYMHLPKNYLLWLPETIVLEYTASILQHFTICGGYLGRVYKFRVYEVKV